MWCQTVMAHCAAVSRSPRAPWDLGIWPPRLSFLTPHTVLNFADGGKIVIKGPKEKVMSELGLGQALTLPSQRYGPSGPDMRETVRYFPMVHR